LLLFRRNAIVLPTDNIVLTGSEDDLKSPAWQSWRLRGSDPGRKDWIAFKQ